VLRKALPGAAADETGPVAGNGLTLQAADLAVAIAASATEVPIGGVVSYTVTVTNRGPADATRLKVDQLLPPSASFVGTASATNPGQGYGCAMHEDQRRISCDTVLLPNGGTWTISVSVRPGAAGALSVSVVASGAESDPNPANDSSVVSTTVRAAR
jgi:uncharacterized repeat protein (TIGR01451 family)